MTYSNRYPVGSFLLTRSRTRVGRMIAAGQALVGDGTRYTHAALVVSDTEVVEALFGGAQLSPLAKYAGRLDVTVCDSPIRVDVVDAVASGDVNPWHALAYEDTLRAEVAAAARSLVGTPYSFLDYASLALLHWNARPAWLLRFVASRRHMICSQLVDTAYASTGLELFGDGRYAGDVTPGDLDRYRIGHLEGRPELAVAA